MIRCALAAALLSWTGLVVAAPDAALTARQEQARQERADLRARIKVLQDQIDKQEASRKAADAALRESETAISDISRRLAAIQEQEQALVQELDALQDQTRQQHAQLERRKQELGEQLRAQYTSGLSPWTALLSGDDPHTIGRELSYLGYVSAAQAQTVRDVNQAVEQLARLHERTRAKQEELAGLAREMAQRHTQLEEQKAERRTVLQRIEADLKAQRGQAERLAADENRLGALIQDLDAEIARQAELARQAEQRRLAEARRQAEEARQAALARQRALEQEQARARAAEDAAREAREQAERERLEREAAQARLQVERARAEAREADRAAAERREEARTLRGEVPGAGQPGAMTGLAKGLPRPVSGDVLGRFGGQRPEGGIWRGIVIRAAEGTHVRAIASGRVAYAGWLGGFGNIIIVDHGQQYMSVYAYNQSLLKEVGDPVGTGDVLAAVGATGGQVEPGLYFEIRHQGKPVNPLLWLRQ
ncbi:MAG TPA: peptidoglycan DD-metalloendopeptidase family protein [Burkholderiaceae bacterium]|nr:peptidoglycan DD-metalloendopeptidase family protein [Burkholderiaceae bacterium]